MTDVIEHILSRRSCPKLKAPAPSKAELERVLQCGMNAPDHGRLKPWRFFVLSGSARDKLGELFLRLKESESGELSDSQREKLLNMPKRAPVLIVAIAETKEHPKVPPIEQAVAVGCALQNMQLALTSMGYGAMWRTGEFAFHPEVKRYFNAKATDEIVGFLYVGTPDGATRPPDTQQVSDTTTFWDE